MDSQQRHTSSHVTHQKRYRGVNMASTITKFSFEPHGLKHSPPRRKLSAGDSPKRPGMGHLFHWLRANCEKIAFRDKVSNIARTFGSNTAFGRLLRLRRLLQTIEELRWAATGMETNLGRSLLDRPGKRPSSPCGERMETVALPADEQAYKIRGNGIVMKTSTNGKLLVADSLRIHSTGC